MKTNIQTINGQVIFKLLLPASLLLFSFMPKNKERPIVQVIKKEIMVEAPFQSIIINGNISVILNNKPAGTVMIEGIETDVNKISYRNMNNELVIDARKKKSFAPLTIYLSATTVKKMLINGDGDISSTGIIKTDDLHIWLNGVVNVDLKKTGNLSVDAYDGYDLFWQTPYNKL